MISRTDLTPVEAITCKWRLAKSGYWTSGCLVFSNETCEGFNFCPYCGRKLEIERHD